ncbi:hypothetical protein ATANTOWER_019467 [Ataeniobius toweri]|uniref:Uncharacterized protein n=1 Tax=Ataeniobius toweri TaxID=208326 RepID=A0ABU7C567_9TELE|nr:hypothetical protein [Ataeniobius toweri]
MLGDANLKRSAGVRFAPSCVLRLKHACVNEAVSCYKSSPSSPLPSAALHPSVDDSSSFLGLSRQPQHPSTLCFSSIFSTLESIHFSKASRVCQA